MSIHPSFFKLGLFNTCLALGLGLGLCSVFSFSANAETPYPEYEKFLTGPQPIELESPPEALQRRLQFSSQDAFSTTFTIGRQFDFLFGAGGFAEMEINRDGSFVNQMYRDYLVQQAQNDRLIRTPDLPNPYDSSILSNPEYILPQAPSPGSEFPFETFPSP